MNILLGTFSALDILYLSPDLCSVSEFSRLLSTSWLGLCSTCIISCGVFDRGACISITTAILITTGGLK